MKAQENNKVRLFKEVLQKLVLGLFEEMTNALVPSEKNTFSHSRWCALRITQ